MKIDVDDPEFLRSLLVKAMHDSFTEEKRTELLTGAITAFLTEKSGYDNKKTKIQQAYEYAIEQVFRAMVALELEKPETRAKIQELVQSTIARALLDADTFDKMGEKIAEAMTAAISRSRY